MEFISHGWDHRQPDLPEFTGIIVRSLPEILFTERQIIIPSIQVKTISVELQKGNRFQDCDSLADHITKRKELFLK